MNAEERPQYWVLDDDSKLVVLREKVSVEGDAYASRAEMYSEKENIDPLASNWSDNATTGLAAKIVDKEGKEKCLVCGEATTLPLFCCRTPARVQLRKIPCTLEEKFLHDCCQSREEDYKWREQFLAGLAQKPKADVTVDLSLHELSLVLESADPELSSLNGRASPSFVGTIRGSSPPPLEREISDRVRLVLDLDERLSNLEAEVHGWLTTVRYQLDRLDLLLDRIEDVEERERSKHERLSKLESRADQDLEVVQSQIDNLKLSFSTNNSNVLSMIQKLQEPVRRIQLQALAMQALPAATAFSSPK